jgi:hypothetical protein
MPITIGPGSNSPGFFMPVVSGNFASRQLVNKGRVSSKEHKKKKAGNATARPSFSKLILLTSLWGLLLTTFGAQDSHQAQVASQ